VTEPARTRILYYEAAPWEQASVAERLPRAQVVAVEGPLLAAAQLPPEAEDAEVLSVFLRSRVDRAVLERLPRLRLVVARSNAVHQVDLAACAERQLTVCYAPHFGEQTVAEHTFALLLALSRRLLLPYLRPQLPGDDQLEQLRGWDLAGKTLGVVGIGRIGLRVAHLATAFGMPVLAYDVQPDVARAEALGVQLAAPEDLRHWTRPLSDTDLAHTVRFVALEELLRDADVVTLHTPATVRTRHLIGAAALARMKPGAVLLNTARGELVDLEALRAALDAGRLGGAALDVVEGDEALTQGTPPGGPPGEERRALLAAYADLWRRPNVVLSPHNAFNSAEALQRLVATTVETIARFLEGQPINVVDQHSL
jgi:D-lactate dehydrogenase